MSYVISADEIKKSLEGYSPNKAEEFHEHSAKLADKSFVRALKESGEPKVILLSGGSASGKSEYVSEYLQKLEAIIVDGTLPTSKGAKIKIDRALKLGKSVEVHGVLPVDFPTAFVVFLQRDRKFSEEHFYRTHSGSRKTLLELAQEYPQVDFKLILSEYLETRERGAMKFTEVDFGTRGGLIEFLKGEQYNEQQIRNKIIHGS